MNWMRATVVNFVRPGTLLVRLERSAETRPGTLLNALPNFVRPPAILLLPPWVTTQKSAGSTVNALFSYFSKMYFTKPYFSKVYFVTKCILPNFPKFIFPKYICQKYIFQKCVFKSVFFKSVFFQNCIFECTFVEIFMLHHLFHEKKI